MIKIDIEWTFLFQVKPTTTIGEIKDHLLENMPMLEYSQIEMEFWCSDVPDAFNVQGICCGLGQTFIKMNICSRSPAFMKMYKYLLDTGGNRQKAKYQTKNIFYKDMGIDINLCTSIQKTLKLAKKRKPLRPRDENTFGLIKETITFLRDEKIEATDDSYTEEDSLQSHEVSLESQTREQRLDDLERQITKREMQISLREQYLNDRNQEALLADLEIVNLPEEQGEDVVHAVTLLASMLGVDFEPSDVVFAGRVGVAQGARAGEVPRRIVVRLARRCLRDQLLQCARARHLSTAAEQQAAVARCIYVNERLTFTNRQLFYRVRQECRRLRWRYSWTKRGQIYAREANGTPAFRIKTVADIERVFGLSPVSQ